MKVLVTGSEGNMGQRIRPVLEAAGHDVIGYDWKFDAEADIRNTKFLTQHMEMADAVIHLAAIPHPEPGVTVEAFLETNLEGTKSVLYAAVEARTIGRFVYGGTGGVYGFEAHLDRAEVLTEADSADPKTVLAADWPTPHMRGYYSSKVLAEDEVRKVAHKFKRGAISLRIDGPGVHNPPDCHRGWGAPWTYVEQAFLKALTVRLPKSFYAVNIGLIQPGGRVGSVDFSRQWNLLGIGLPPSDGEEA